MQNLYKITAKAESAEQNFIPGEIVSIAYHDIFDYPLTVSELIRWKAGKSKIPAGNFSISGKNGYFFIEGREGLIYKKTLRKRISERKLKIAGHAAQFLSAMPLVKMVAVTGSLAMENAGDESDIDLMVVTKAGNLWTTRLLSHFLIKLAGFPVRKSGEADQKDKLCLNIWMEETDLSWQKNRNIYTAHEISQIRPLVNKDKTFERFISENRWIKKFWPNAVKTSALKPKKIKYATAHLFEKIAFLVQLQHMKSKITNETITSTRALFHPQDWGKIVLSRLSS